MEEQAKKKQHYVWQHYLKQWVNKENRKLSCFDKTKNKLYQTATKDTSWHKFFYKVEQFSYKESSFIEKMFENCHNPKTKKKIYLFYIGISSLFEERNLAIKNGNWLLEDSHKFDIKCCNYEENFHCDIENRFAIYLDKCLKDEIDFTNDCESRYDFAYCIWIQYMRTKKVYDLFLDAYEKEMQKDINFNGGISFPKVFRINKFLLADKLADDYRIKTNNLRFRLIQNISNIDFITSDQPAINLNPNNNQSEIDLYYPISPNRAIRISKISNLLNDSIIQISNENEISELNLQMAKQAHRFIYSHDLESLKQFEIDIKSMN